MIALRRNAERSHEQNRKREVWLTFDPRKGVAPLDDGFGGLETLGESRLPPGTDAPRHPRHDTEIVTYVREGALAYEDSLGRSGIIRAGEFQRVTTARGMRRSESNVSRSEFVHVFQIRLRSATPLLDTRLEQKRFGAAQRRGGPCIVASPDARKGSLHLCHDALLYSAMLEPGQHVVHELSPGRGAWLHVVHGEATLGDLALVGGDGVGVTGERAVSFTARATSEILLVELGMAQ